MPLAGTLTQLHEMLTGLPPALVLGLTFLAVALETSLLLGLLVPGDLVLLVAATTVTTPGRFVGLVLAGIAGALVGESIGYALGGRYGTRFRTSRLGRRLGEQRWLSAAGTLERWGPRAIVAARFVPVVHALLPVVAGTTRYPFARFLRWCGIAGVCWSVVYASAGALAGSQIAQVRGSFGLVGYAVIVGVVGVLLAKVVRAGLRRRGDRAGRRVAPGSDPVTGLGADPSRDTTSRTAASSDLFAPTSTIDMRTVLVGGDR